MQSSTLFQVIVLFSFLFVALGQDAGVEGIPAQVCGNQTFSTSYVSGGSITFTLTSTSNVDLSVDSVTYTDTNEVEITITCQGRGPAEIVFDTQGRNIQEIVRFYCAGIISVGEAPSVVPRGSEFSLDLFLTPTPVSPVQLIVESLSPLITPGSERVVFGVEQSLANENFYVPNSFVGPAEVLFRSRSLRDYNGPGCAPLSVQFIVQGELESSLNDMVVAAASVVPVTVSVFPAYTEDVVVTIETSSGDAPASVTILARETEVTFNLNVTAAPFDTDACVTFSSEYYTSVKSCFDVIGGFTSDISDQLNTFARETFSVAPLPFSGDEEITITIETTANVDADSQVFIQAGESSGLFQIIGLEAGEGWIDFSAPNYMKQRFFFTIIDVVCNPENQIINTFGTECLDCPSLDGELICSGHGTCARSPSASEEAICICEEGFTGGYCEFADGEVERFTSGQSINTYRKPFPSVFELIVTLRSAFIDQIMNGYFLIYEATTTFIPEVENSLVSLLPGGFIVYAVAEDNTIIRSFDAPARFVFEFDRTMSQLQILQQVLFYRSNTLGWIPAIDACPPQFQLVKTDLISKTTTVNLCVPGQYQFYQVAPLPSHAVPTKGFFPAERFVYDDLSVYYSSSGLGVADAVEPPQPTFAPLIQDAQTSESYSSTQTVDSDFISVTSPKSSSSSSGSPNSSGASSLKHNISLVFASIFFLMALVTM